MRDETELIRAAASGDRRAFDELVTAKRERVVRTAYQITGNMDDALDVAQVVFLKVWQGLARFDLRRKLDTWVYRITSNAAIDLLRSRGPRGQTRSLSDDGVDVDVPDEAPDADLGLDRARLQAAFMRLAGDLAPKQRAAFVLREIEGQSTAEVARILDVTESTVRNHLLQARRTLKAGLLRDYPDLVPGADRGGEDAKR